MKRYLVAILTILPLLAFGQHDHGHSHDDHGHSHGHEVEQEHGHGTTVEFELKVVDSSSGKSVTSFHHWPSASIVHENETLGKMRSKLDKGSGVYKAKRSFEEAGAYQVQWNIEGLDQKVTFDLLLSDKNEAHEEHGSSLVYVGGIIAALVLIVLAFVAGRKAGAARGVTAFVIAAILATKVSVVIAQDHGHDHGPDGHSHGTPVNTPQEEEENLLVGLGEIGNLTETKSVGSYTISMTVKVIPQDNSVLHLTETQEKVLQIELETVGETPLGTGITTTGQVKADPARLVRLSPLVAGRVASVNATKGEYVSKGQQLAVIESPDAAGVQSEYSAAESNKLRAEADLKRAEANLKVAEATLVRQKEFAKAGAFSQPSLQTARNELLDAQRDEAEAQSTLEQAKSEQATHQRELERVRSLHREGLASKRELEAAELEAEQDVERLRQARSRLKQAQERVRLAESAVKREEQILAGGLQNRRVIEEAEADVARAKADHLAAKTELSATNKALEAVRLRLRAVGVSPGQGSRTVVQSPISGIIVERQANIGESVDTHDPLFEILDSSEVWVEGDVFEADIPAVSQGLQVQVSSDAAPGRMFTGEISSIDQVIDQASRAARVRVVVANPDGALKINQFAKMLIVTNMSEKRVTVPIDAVQEVSGLKSVFVKDGDAYKIVPVKLGNTLADRVEVLEGLKDGDKIVVQGAYQLRLIAAR